MPAHHRFVVAFDAGLKGAPLPPGVTAMCPDETTRRFAVYRNNVAVSLTDALAKRFPVIQRLVGEPFFAALARLYAETHRPTSPVLLEWGGSFPAFLAEFPALADYPYMADVARIELARGAAFHAADATPVPPESLLDVDPSHLCLRLHASVQVLRLSSPGVSIWQHNQPDATAKSLTLAGAEIALILRDRAFNVPVLAISAADAAMIEQLQTGSSLTTAAEAALGVQPTHDPTPLLVMLMQMGAIVTPEGPLK